MANSKKNTTAKNNNKSNTKKTSTKNPSTKKSTAKKSSQAKKADEKTKAMQGEILSVTLIGVSLIMFVCVLTQDNTGAFGRYISSFLITAFGIGAMALPIVLFVFSVQTLFSDQKSKFKTKLMLFIGFFIVFISTAYIMSRNGSTGSSLSEFIYKNYTDAKLSNGGLVGALIGEGLYLLIGEIGSFIVLLTALVVLFILATGKSVVGFINKIGDLIDGVKEDYIEYSGYEEYDEDYVEEKPVKQKPPKKKKNNQAPGQMELDLDEKPKNKKSKKPKNERVVTFNIENEDPTPKDDDILFDNKFILENNKIYNKPKEHEYTFTKLGKLVDEAGEMRATPKEHYVYNLPEDEQNIQPNIEDNVEEENIAEMPKSFIDNEVNEKSAIPIKDDAPPFDVDDDSIAKQALQQINQKFVHTEENIYAPHDAPEIIEAEKTKTLEKLKVKSDKEYNFPKLSFLGKNPQTNISNRQEMLQKAKQLENVLNIFNINVKINNISQGPAVTRYELTPPQGVRVKDIVNLENDIALALAARSIRMEAPIPGKSAIGIEIPNDQISMVYFREVLTNEKFQNFKGKLAFGIGKDITGNVIVQDIAKMPHLLIAGSTGSGKSVCINTLITSILYKYSPKEVRLIMVDPKIVELGVYNGIPHLLVPVVTDPQKAAGALNWAVREMMRRYDLFATKGVRNLEGYNNVDDIEEKLPQIVVIIDELADLMMVAKKDVEASIQRLTQLARAAGIHLVIATQRPSVNVITGVIKANVPSRIAFKVASSTDSRTILDSSGAEKLLGKGDMLFQAGDMDKPLRIQGAFVTDQEIEKIVQYIKVDDANYYDQSIISEMSSNHDDDNSNSSGSDFDGSDDLINDVIKFVVNSQKASTSLIQRKFRIGFNRAARIIDELEDRGIIGPDQGGTKGRVVMMDKYELSEWNDRQQNL